MKKAAGWVLDNLHWLTTFIIALWLVWGDMPHTSSEGRDGLMLLWLVVVHLDIRWVKNKMKKERN